MTLNPGQQEALDAVLTGQNVFLTGPGGTGKSFLIHRIVEELQERKKKVAVTALTGCAALLLGKDAKTIHSWAGIGLGRDKAVVIVANMKKYRHKVQRRWLLMNTLIIDEISMMTPEILQLLDEVGRLVRRDDRKPFGGIQVILVGDFFQLPPVVKGDDTDKKGETSFVFESPLWQTLGLKVCRLTQVVRQDDPVFHKVLEEARVGKLSKESLQVLQSRQTTIWQDLKIKPTLLFSRRAEVEMINEQNFKALPGPIKRYEAKTLFDTTVAKGLTEQTKEVQFAVSKMDRDAPYKVELQLKIGAQVMLIYNLDQEAGLVNGSRGVVEGFDAETGLPLVLFKGHSKAIPVGVQSWESEELDGVKRSQIPLILAYAITIHKSQGATLDSALIDIGPSTFEVGQAYVALSRVKSLDSLYVFDLDPLAFKAHPKVCCFYDSLVPS
jgi:ATP-dependent DNA helicase PIF1